MRPLNDNILPIYPYSFFSMVSNKWCHSCFVSFPSFRGIPKYIMGNFDCLHPKMLNMHLVVKLFLPTSIWELLWELIFRPDHASNKCKIPLIAIACGISQLPKKRVLSAYYRFRNSDVEELTRPSIGPSAFASSNISLIRLLPIWIVGVSGSSCFCFLLYTIS